MIFPLFFRKAASVSVFSTFSSTRKLVFEFARSFDVVYMHEPRLTKLKSQTAWLAFRDNVSSF